MKLLISVIFELRYYELANNSGTRSTQLTDWLIRTFRLSPTVQLLIAVWSFFPLVLQLKASPLNRSYQVICTMRSSIYVTDMRSDLTLAWYGSIYFCQRAQLRKIWEPVIKSTHNKGQGKRFSDIWPDILGTSCGYVGIYRNPDKTLPPFGNARGTIGNPLFCTSTIRKWRNSS